MSRRSRLILAGRIVFAALLAGLIVYFAIVGLDKADKLASTIGVVVALVAFFGPHLLPASPPSGAVWVEDSGNATATSGGSANTGVRGGGPAGPATVIRSGDARADGPASVANTGIEHRG
ncbi:hypothetical protein AB0C29_09790 [Actinoplanes sp. NPDC048791]|uniref:hypothetical protein n=1 Tax=Actinoplanes sp. NPDC048791 TaxID=3154623 RepID=UPI0033D1B579